MRWLIRLFGFLLLALGLLSALTIRSGDPALYPPKPGEGVPIHLVSNGYHTGLILPRRGMAEVAGREGRPALIAVAEHFGDYDPIEIGWGEGSSTARCRPSLP